MSHVTVAFFLFVCGAGILFNFSDGVALMPEMSVNLAQAVDAEMKAHLIRMDLRAEDLHKINRRVVREMKENHARIRSRREASYQIKDLRHGFVPGTGVGNRETLEIERMTMLPSNILRSTVRERIQWENFFMDKKPYLVTCTSSGWVTIWEFNAADPEVLNLVFNIETPCNSIETFTQSYYSNGVTTEETKIVVFSEDETIVIVDNGGTFQSETMSINPTDVTDIDFFSIGLDSYLVFTRNTDAAEGDKSVIYLWSSTNKVFGLRQEFRTYGAQYVQAFEMIGNNYLFVIEKNNQSTIWRYHKRQNQFTIFQRLGTDGHHGLYFTQAYESYIVLITADRSTTHLFHWDGIKFRIAQTIQTPMATKWATITDPASCQDAPLLALSSTLPWPQALQLFNVTKSLLYGGEFPCDGCLPVNVEGLIVGTAQLLQFTDRRDAVYIVVVFEGNGGMHSSIFKLYTGIIPVPSPYAQAVETALEEAVKVVRESVDIYQTKVVDGEAALRDKVSLKDGDLSISGNITFNGTIIFNGTVIVDEIIADDVVVDNTVDGEPLSAVLGRLEAKADQNTGAVQKLRQSFDDRVTKSGTQTITAHKIFNNLAIDGALQANTITAPTINGVDIEALENSIVRNNEDGQTVNGALTFSDDVTVDGDLSLNNGVLVNGFNMANAVLETGSQTISGAKTFTGDVSVTGDAVVQNGVTIDSVDVSEHVVTLAGTHTLASTVTLNDVLTVNSNIVTTSTVDGVDVSAMDADTVREAGDVTITGPVTFSQSVTVDDDVTIGGTANEIDLSDFDARAVRHDVDTTITGVKTFSDDIEINGELDLQGSIDGVELFSDALLVNHTNSTGLKNSFIEGLLLPYGTDEGDSFIPKDDDTNFVMVPMEQSIQFFGQTHTTIFLNMNGLLSFTEPVPDFIPRPFPIGDSNLQQSYIAPFWADVDIRVGGNIYYRQLLNPSADNVALKEINRIICHSLRVHFYANWIFITTWDSVAYFGSTSSITNTFQSVVASDGTHAYVIFNYDDINWTTGKISGGSVSTGLGGFSPAVVGVNAGDGELSYSVPDSNTPHIVNIGDTSNINVPGRYVFEVGVDNTQDFQGQVITGSKTFTSRLKVAGSVTVNGLTDGIDFDDVVTLLGSSTIEADKVFDGGIMVQGDLHTSGLIDGVDVSLIASQVMKLSGRQTVAGAVTFTSDTVVEEDVVVSGTVNDVDIAAMEADAVYADEAEEQVITAAKTFTDTLSVGTSGSVTFTGLVNTYDVETDFMDLTSQQSVTAPPGCTDPTGVNYRGTLAETIYGETCVDWTSEISIDQDAVDAGLGDHNYCRNPDVESTAWCFTADSWEFCAVGHLGPECHAKTFTNGFTVSSDLSVTGTVDEVTMSTLWSEAALVSGSETLAGDKSFAGAMSVTGDLTVGGTVNTVDLSTELMMLDVTQEVTGSKTFTCFTATGNLQAVNGDITNLNEQDWTGFVSGRTTLSTEQKIFGDVTFADTVTVNGDIGTSSLVNTIDLPTLYNSVLYKTGGQTITGAKTFTDTVDFDGAISISGTLDGVNIEDMSSRAIYLNDGAQTITAVKTFTDLLSVSNHITLTGDVNGVDLADLNSDIVWTNAGTQTITGKKIFNSGFHASQSITVSGTVNTIDISDDVLTLNQDQTITGAYTFSADVQIDETLTVSGPINDVNIQALDADAMKKDEVQTISSPIVFTNDMSVSGDITVNPTETVDTVDLSELKDIAKFIDEPFTLPNAVTFELPVTFNAALDVTGTVHGKDLEAWEPTVLTKDGTQTITGDHTIEGTFQATDISVPTDIQAVTAYGINIDTFVPDAVKLQGDRTITGTKTFTNDVIVEGSITVADTVDGVDISAEIVTLDGAQTISGAKTFDTCDVQTAGNILIQEKVNNIEISKEAADTLDFRSPQKMEGAKTFSRDTTVAGAMQFNGLVDGKDITEGVTLATEQTVEGYYVFNQKASVTGSVTVTGLVKTVDLANIDTKRVTLSGSNTVSSSLTFNNMVILEDNVTTAYLFDGVDLSELGAEEITQYDEYEDELYELACFAETQCERTDSIVTIVNNFIDAIDYLENVQIISEHVRRFEPFSLNSSTFLAAAIYADEHSDVCTSSIVYRFNTATGQFEEFQKLPTNGAVTWEHFFIDDVLYLVVANAGHAPCEDPVIAGNSLYRHNAGRFELAGSVGEDTAATSDVATFTINGDNFLVFTTIEGNLASVYKYNDVSEIFQIFQDINTGVTVCVESVLFDDKVFLVFTLYLLEESAVYHFSPADQKFKLLQNVEAEHARVVTSFSYQSTYGFALADHISVVDVDDTVEVQIRVYTWNAAAAAGTGLFELSWTLGVVDPGDVDIFMEGNFLYMCVVQEYHSVDFYRYEGAAGFVKSHEVPHHGVRSVEIISLQEDEYAAEDDIAYEQLFLAVAVDPFPKHDIYSRVLKVVNLGGSVHVDTKENMCDSNLQEARRIDTPHPTC